MANGDDLFEPSGKKYPNWAEIYMAKALVYYIFHEPVFMQKALNEACRLGNYTACDDLKNIKRVHEYDFGISAIKWLSSKEISNYIKLKPASAEK